MALKIGCNCKSDCGLSIEQIYRLFWHDLLVEVSISSWWPLSCWSTSDTQQYLSCLACAVKLRSSLSACVKQNTKTRAVLLCSRYSSNRTKGSLKPGCVLAVNFSAWLTFRSKVKGLHLTYAGSAWRWLSSRVSLSGSPCQAFQACTDGHVGKNC